MEQITLADRTVTVYLPEGYGEKRYPVLYMHDGQNVFRDSEAVGGVSLGLEQYLAENGLEVIVAAIHISTEKGFRVNEYCPWEGGLLGRQLSGDAEPRAPRGTEYVDWIVQELKPLIDHTYRTLPEQTFMAGISLGAHISLYAAIRYPHIFKRIGAVSAGFYRNQEKLEDVLAAADLSGLERVYMDCGTREAGPEEEVSRAFLASNQAICDRLQEKGVPVEFYIMEGAEHSYSCFRQRVPELLGALLKDA
ncbi:alpha/beta hydrolase [Ectobacillus ponti]|uniref:Esterase family protein n=1 Tax=Ectobacillus ponti TaxID=2961894 RepID=A0AA41X7B4_9BACI|nr:esterase family protein [Ectobacillus ponti]